MASQAGRAQSRLRIMVRPGTLLVALECSGYNNQQEVVTKVHGREITPDYTVARWQEQSTALMSYSQNCLLIKSIISGIICVLQCIKYLLVFFAILAFSTAQQQARKLYHGCISTLIMYERIDTFYDRYRQLSAICERP